MLDHALCVCIILYLCWIAGVAHNFRMDIVWKFTLHSQYIHIHYSPNTVDQAMASNRTLFRLGCFSVSLPISDEIHLNLI